MTKTARTRLWPLVALLGVVYFAYDVGSQQFLVGGEAQLLSGPLRVEYIPNPTDIVNLAEGTPYTVPAGKVLIITDWIVTDVELDQNGVLDNPFIQPRIRVNGADVWGGGFSSKHATYSGISLASSGTNTLSGSLRSGLRANAGDVVTLTTIKSPATGYSGTPTTFASGYLARAH